MSPTPDPLDPGLAARAQQRWDEATTATLAGPPSHGVALDIDATVDGALARLEAAARSGSEVASLPTRRRARLGLGIAVAALAAAVMVWTLRPQAPLLPHHTAEFEGGIRTLRGDADPRAGEPAVFLPASRLRWSFAPATASTIPVALRIEVRGDGTACLDPTGVRRAPTGAIELAGPVGELLPLPPGSYELIALIGPADRVAGLPDPCALEDGARPVGVIEVDLRRIELRAGP
ncbi:MAG: hypothetical protein JNK45_15740 [Myxococcales bacterium]|nr:hypothetical protein [Myxococcales bacterium]